ncbi:hypothetical protein LEP1GSC186_2896 [Leptospira noguchii serovar Autumnalis str. ZUN142]|uniref:Uncharacterized protein n=1 Tax=Leptospira noguchii serovar Autumnalis str. ZUN142 TaxID=1085540 RepID=M6U2V4_9LEPT|nr:hypothetical protein LEP1GSC186_2896 [Leptospira noguchii serovar Autumnalis str. ZUN142]
MWKILFQKTNSSRKTVFEKVSSKFYFLQNAISHPFKGFLRSLHQSLYNRIS